MNNVFLCDLEDLTDILESLVFEDEPSILTQEYAIELVESAFHLMEDYMDDNPTAITEPDFEEFFMEEIKDIFYIQFEEHILNSDFIEDDLNDILEEAFQIYITTFHTERSIAMNVNTESDDATQITKIAEMNIEEINMLTFKINNLRNKPQPEQRTNAWYKFRHNLITASNAYKAFESQATINQLIYEKCQPLKTESFEKDNIQKIVNVNTPMHHGQKYEPLSVMIYEYLYKSKVEDFGCIQHEHFLFLGASPDGIVVDKTSERYGRMLEIKNIVNREITGIPKKEYWVQMQLQMEVCDLDKCDFLETKFVEYLDYNSYQNDDIRFFEKGIIIYFHNSFEGKPFYVYKPLDILKKEDIEKWEEDTIALYQSKKYNYTFMKFIYWKLEKLSCVLVLRNKEWFKNNIVQLEKVWRTIETERVTGYEHRAPNRRVKKEEYKPLVKADQGCLLRFNKIIKIDTEISMNDTNDMNDMNDNLI